MSWDDDAALAAGVKAGNPEAVAVFWRELAARWLNYIVGSIGPTDAEDVLQEIFVACHKGLRSGRLAFDSKLWPWTRGVVRHCLCDYLAVAQKRARTVMTGDRAFRIAEETHGAREPNPEQRQAAGEAAEMLSRAFATLTDRERDIVRRFYFLHQPREWIERELELTPTQFRLQKSVALGKMRDYVHRAVEHDRHPREPGIEWAA